uniref:Uncharacterized protein n=1 Tax=Globisporangium ultimum (strain ATCC 200006 / CBS 805.95 / DAOM BR144) TaxID=431595 RepID=K3WR37_GLOUD
MDRFVWERWRNVWYMGRVVDEKPASTGNALVKIHIHGEADTNDKWFPVDSANLVFLAVVPNKMTAIGEFPVAGAYVELFLLDQPLLDALSIIMDQTPSENASIERSWTLVGKVDHVVPAHDASVVDVAYPSAYHRVARERRLHIGNGYVSLSVRAFFYVSDATSK